MLNTYTSTTQTVNSNENVKFDVNRIWTSPCIKHPSGSDTTSLARQGYYKVEFNASGAALTASPTSLTNLQLFNKDTPIPGANSAVHSGGTSAAVNFSFTGIVPVSRSCSIIDNSAILTIKNTGDPISLTNANLIITRLGNLNGN